MLLVNNRHWFAINDAVWQNIPMPAGTRTPPGVLTRTVGAIFRARMARRDLTLLDLTNVVNVSVPQLSKILRGRAHIDLEQFNSICSYLGLDPEKVWQEAKSDIDEPVGGNRAESAGSVTTEAEPAGREPQVDQIESDLDSAEVGRRLRRLVENIVDGDTAAGYRRVAAALARADAHISTGEWASAVAGKGRLAHKVLSAVADGMGVPAGYLTREDPELRERVESELVLARAMQEAGATQIAARGELSPDALREIAALVSRRISK